MSKELKTLVSADEPMSSSDSDDDYAKPSKKRQKKIPTEYIEYEHGTIHYIYITK